jgi:hypothetical protein
MYNVYVYVHMIFLDIFFRFPYVCVYVNIRGMELMENGNFRLLAANGNGKRKFVFLGRQTINGNRRLLFQQTCLSMLAAVASVKWRKIAGKSYLLPVTVQT